MKKLNQSGYIEAILATVVVVILLVGGVVGIVTFVNWNNKHQTERGRGDAPTGQVNTEPRKVYQMPDAFSNVASFCDEYGNSVYVTTKTDGSRGVWALKDGCDK